MRENVFAGSVITANSPFWQRLVDPVVPTPESSMSRSCRCRGHERSGPTVAVKPVSQPGAADLPLPRLTQPRLVEHRGERVVVVARQVDVDLGDLTPGGQRQREQVDLGRA